MPETNRLEGRSAIVTGAGQGIGRAIARRLGQEGGKVVVAERGEEVLAGEASRWTLQPCEGNVCEFEKLESGACRRRAGAGAEE